MKLCRTRGGIVEDIDVTLLVWPKNGVKNTSYLFNGVRHKELLGGNAVQVANL